MKEEICKSFLETKCYAVTGRVFGISRQRVHQIVTGYRSPESLQGRDFSREIVRKRDNYTCQICKKLWVKGTRRFDVHHMNDKNGSKTKSYDKKSDLDQLVTLCHKCHMCIESMNGKID